MGPWRRRGIRGRRSFAGQHDSSCCFCKRYHWQTAYVSWYSSNATIDNKWFVTLVASMISLTNIHYDSQYVLSLIPMTTPDTLVIILSMAMARYLVKKISCADITNRCSIARSVEHPNRCLTYLSIKQLHPFAWIRKSFSILSTCQFLNLLASSDNACYTTCHGQRGIMSCCKDFLFKRLGLFVISVQLIAWRRRGIWWRRSFNSAASQGKSCLGPYCDIQCLCIVT